MQHPEASCVRNSLVFVYWLGVKILFYPPVSRQTASVVYLVNDNLRSVLGLASAGLHAVLGLVSNVLRPILGLCVCVSEIFHQRCISRATKIIRDSHHPSHCLLSFLSSDRRYTSICDAGC